MKTLKKFLVLRGKFMEKLKVGIIGAGRIGQVHAKSITYLKGRHSIMNLKMSILSMCMM